MRWLATNSNPTQPGCHAHIGEGVGPGPAVVLLPLRPRLLESLDLLEASAEEAPVPLPEQLPPHPATRSTPERSQPAPHPATRGTPKRSKALAPERCKAWAWAGIGTHIVEARLTNQPAVRDRLQHSVQSLPGSDMWRTELREGAGQAAVVGQAAGGWDG